MNKTLLFALLTLLTLSLQAKSPIPKYGRCRIDCFYQAIHPGDHVRIFLTPESSFPITQINATLVRSKYLRQGGKGEKLVNLQFKPTGKTGEFMAEFTAPKTSCGLPGKQLPEKPYLYRLEVTSYVDTKGNTRSHRFTPVGRLLYGSSTGKPVIARTKFPNIAMNGSGPSGELLIGNRDTTPKTMEYNVTVKDFYGITLHKLEGELIVPPKTVKKQTLMIPAANETGKYRIYVTVKNKINNNIIAEIVSQVLSDITTGSRRVKYLNNADWEMSPETDINAKRPAGNAKWQSGRYSSKMNWNEPFGRLGKGVKALWVRTKFELPSWFNSEIKLLAFDEINVQCDVYLNDQFAGSHAGPYYPFTISTKNLLKPGMNDLLIKVTADLFGSNAQKGDVVIDEQLRRVAPHAPANIGKSRRRIWPMNSHGGVLFGVCRSVKLLGMPTTYLKNVFPMTSVQNKTLTCRASIKNTSAKQQNLIIKHTVYDKTEKVFELPGKSYKIDTNTNYKTQAEGIWKTPELWWPKSPHLYCLKTTLTDQQGNVVDTLKTRFGFREIRISGYDFLFNGKRLKTRMFTAMPHARMPFNRAYAFWKKRLQNHIKGKNAAPFLIRIHNPILTEAFFDLADEMGVFMELDGPLGSNRNDWASKDLWKNYKAMVKDWIMTYRNHPSILFWALENETLVCTNIKPTYFKHNQQELLKLGRFAKKLDPTRPILFEGDADIDGSWEVATLHYPRYWYLHPKLPNDAFWLKRGIKNAKLDMCYPSSFSWDKPKPIYMGEDSLFIEAYTPHDFSAVGGSRVYKITDEKGRAFAGRPVDAEGHAMFIEGYRNAEVAITTSALGGSLGEPLEKAQIPIRSFVKERSSRFYGGRTIPRHISLHHDVLEDAEVTFSWDMQMDGKTIQSDSMTYNLEAGALKRLIVNLKIPEVDTITPLVFNTQVKRHGEICFEETIPYQAYPKRNIKPVESLRLGVFDRHKQTGNLLRKNGIPFIDYGTVEPGTLATLEHLNCLLIGENGLDRARLRRLHGLKPFLEKGGVIICLKQDMSLEYLPAKPLPQDLRRETTISWRRNPFHPILNDVSDDMLRYWYGDNVVSREDFLKQPRFGWQPIIDSGGPGGLRWASVVEMPVDKGSIVFCQLEIIKKFADEPAAMILLQNMLNYAAQHQPVQRKKLAIHATPLTEKRLKEINALTGSSDAKVLIIDANKEAVKSEIEEINQKITAGSTVLLHGLTPDNLKQWQELLPTDFKLKEVNRKHSLAMKEAPILAGISPTDLWWGYYAIWSFKEKGGCEILYSAQSENKHAETLVKYGGLLQVDKGKGTLYIDQMRWTADDVNAKRSGQYISLLLYNLLYGNL
jgi:hypothetical protein